jgi:hypothetical protein
MKQTVAKFMPYLLNDDWKQNRLPCARNSNIGPRRSDFFSKVFMFPNMKVQVKRRRVKDITRVEAEWETVLNRTMKREFRRCFQQWE